MIDIEVIKEVLQERKGLQKRPGKQVRKKAKRSIEEISKDREMAKLVEEIIRVIEKTPEVRSAKIKEIKEKIKAGEFTIDTKKIADKILQESILEELL